MLWLVRQDHQAPAAGPGLEEFHLDRGASFPEEFLASSQYDWMQPELILVDELVLNQRLGQPRTTHDNDRPSRLPLEPGDVRRDIANHGRSLPVGPLQGR